MKTSTEEIVMKLAVLYHHFFKDLVSSGAKCGWRKSNGCNKKPLYREHL